MTTALAIAISTLFFLVVHILVRGRWGVPFHVELRVSRGIAALCLVLAGFYALVRWFPTWRHAFLDHHEAGSLPFYLVCFVTGHLVADFVWLAWGAWAEGSSPRRDLIVHHALGLFGCWVVLHFEFGHVLLATAMTTEMMPTLTGVEAWAQLAHKPRVARQAPRIRLGVILGWRLPFWVFLLVGLARPLVAGDVTEEPLRTIHIIGVGGVVTILAMDLYWTLQMVRKLRLVEGATGPVGRGDGVVSA